jgi:hypothetical protein
VDECLADADKHDPSSKLQSIRSRLNTLGQDLRSLLPALRGHSPRSALVKYRTTSEWPHLEQRTGVFFS